MMSGQSNSLKNIRVMATFACGTLAFMSGALLATNPQTQPATGPATTQAATRNNEQRRQDEINRAMAFFKATQPDVYEQALALRTSDPAKFDKLIMSAMPTVNRLEGMRKKNPKLFELSMLEMQLGYKSLRLAHDLKRPEMSDVERQKSAEELHQIISDEFDVQQQIRQIEIDDLQAKIKDLDDQVKARAKDKDGILQKRGKDLNGDAPRLEW